MAKGGPASGSDDDEPFDLADIETRDEGEALVVDIDGFEGPLDLLLTLARQQKVDLRQISILALAEQYLAFVAEVREKRIELAADYLVMAAWLAYLKSRLLLPKPQEDGPSGEELAARLAFRLQRLDAMRQAAARLFARDRLGRDVFPRGVPEKVTVTRTTTHTATLFDLLSAYAAVKSSHIRETYEVRRPFVYTMDDALNRLRTLVGHIGDWTDLESFLPPELRQGGRSRSALAGTFAATLELVRQGELDLRQSETFGPLEVRRRKE
ncbi:MAG: segregation/condensation protein A [Alphaproteobacteria bacterium]|mgnify:CR=1 FL=1|nr:segregation/condensation protein A [Alphaproteobacteria bacterium]MDX5367750.1 segregation/condensation protein A [Alphaproteobacteria bacterium]MDX5462633.1 segregation/condensation protein A [Alphaproteobacteria bacterium]